jgi:hypothetical protein
MLSNTFQLEALKMKKRLSDGLTTYLCCKLTYLIIGLVILAIGFQMDGFTLGAIIFGSFVGASFLTLVLSMMIWPPRSQHHQFSRPTVIRRRAMSRTIGTVSVNAPPLVPSRPIYQEPAVAIADAGNGGSETDIELGQHAQIVCATPNCPREAVAVVINRGPVIQVVPETATIKGEVNCDEVAVVVGRPVNCVY